MLPPTEDSRPSNAEPASKASPVPLAKGRYQYVDAFRGCAICGIIFAHATLWWLTLADNVWFVVNWKFFMIFGAPAFLFVSGASLTLSKKGAAETHIMSLLIFIIGALASLPWWGAWIWNSLVIIGFSQFIGYYLRNMKPAALLAIAASIIIVTPVLFLTNNSFLFGEESIRYILVNFPPFPALAYFIAGMGFMKIEKKGVYLLVIGLFVILMTVGLSSSIVNIWIGASFTVIILAVVFLLFRIYPPKSETIEIFGKNSLTGYCIQESTVYIFGWQTWHLYTLLLLPIYVFGLSRLLKLMRKYGLTVERGLQWMTKKIQQIKSKKNGED